MPQRPAKPKDDDSGEPAASGAKPAAAAASEATSGSASAEPDKSAETAKPAEQDDKTAARDSDIDRDQQRQVTVVPGVPRYHTDNCILIRFMDDDDVQQMSLKAATGAGCTPCGACQPDH